MNLLRLSVLALLLGTAVVPAAIAQDEKKDPPEAEDKRVYVVMVRTETQRMYVLEKTKVQKLGDVTFLSGKLVGTVGSADWRVGSTLWLPLAEVTQMSEYPNLTDLQKQVTLNK